MLLDNIDRLILEYTNKYIDLPEQNNTTGLLDFRTKNNVTKLHKIYSNRIPKDYSIHTSDNADNLILKHKDGSFHYWDHEGEELDDTKPPSHSNISKIASDHKEFRSKFKQTDHREVKRFKKIKEFEDTKEMLKRKNIEYEEMGLFLRQPKDNIRIQITQNGKERDVIYNSNTDEIKFEKSKYNAK